METNEFRTLFEIYTLYKFYLQKSLQLLSEVKKDIKRDTSFSERRMSSKRGGANEFPGDGGQKRFASSLESSEGLENCFCSSKFEGLSRLTFFLRSEKVSGKSQR